jgi:glycosyltransferase involved in cell wall biosynthesis
LRIVWFSWKDHAHPAAGGAEVVKTELAKRLVADGHELTILTARYPGSKQSETHDGYTIIRLNNWARLGVYWNGWLYYRKHLKDWPDVVIDEVNTLPFFAAFYSKKPTILFIHQLARQIWFHEMFFPLNGIGFCLEPIYLWLQRRKPVITVSDSTRRDLLRFGFMKSNIQIIPEGITIPPLKNLPQHRSKNYRLLIFGALRSMKRPDHAIKAFELAKQQIPELTIDVAGAPFGAYGQKLVERMKTSAYASDITYHGRVSVEQKIQLMKNADFLLVASQKEGWGLIVSEAASQGTVSIVYNVDGLRDAVFYGKGGLLSEPNPEALAKKIIEVYQHDQSPLRIYAYQQAKRMTFDRSYSQFITHLTALTKN